ncbi:MAG: universal stress protein [Verrucomicrobiota bacterium]
MSTTAPRDLVPAAGGVFRRVLCGVDLSAASREATRQAARLVDVDGSLLVVAVAVGEAVAITAPAGVAAAVADTAVDEPTRARYRAALAEAARSAGATFPQTQSRLLEGEPVTTFLETLAAERATLAVVGSHDYHRMQGIVLGSMATHVLHKAPCSVLVARPPEGGVGRLLVGVDGSDEAAFARAVAAHLAVRLDREVETLVAYGGRPLHDLDAVTRLAPLVETFDEPVHALVSRAGPDDLVVVGSRSLHGLRALGSVSERVAHRAPCSVLVVRTQEGT